MTVYRRGPHRTQFDGAGGGQRCTPTSGANGAREATDGAYDHSGAFVYRLFPESEQTNPSTPGWSMVDLDHGMRVAGIPFSIGTGGWAGVRAAHASGRGIALQGDSDVFGNNTCSGVFDGDHCIYVHPEVNALGEWLIGDPICSNWRWEKESVLRAYAEKFYAPIHFGIFSTPVRKLAANEEEPPMAQKSITDKTPALFDIPVGAKSYNLDGSADPTLPTYTKAYSNIYSPYAVGTQRAFFAKRDDKTVLRLIAGAKNTRPVADNTPYAQADVDKARAAGFTAGAASVVTKIKQALGL